MSKTLKIVFGGVYVLVLGLLSFLYRFITDFPIGDDPAIHVRTIKSVSYVDLLSTNYPLPLSIYKLASHILPLQRENLFVILVCFFLFLSGLAIWLLAKKITKSNLLACLSSFVFVTTYWTFDGLRMGLLPEVFGWFVLLLSLYFLVSRNIVMLALFSVLLPLSHPYGFTVFVLIFILHALITTIFSDKKDKIFILKMLAIYAIITVVALVAKPEIINKFSSFVNPEVIGWGERNFFEWFSASQKRRVFLAVFALIGAISSLKYWREDRFKLLYVFLFVGMFMAMNQYFSVRFQVFRFAPYFEMPLAIFAVLGMYRITETFGLKFKLYYLGMISLSCFILLPQIYANYRVTYGMSKIAENNNSMSSADRVAIKWLSENSAPSDKITAPYKWQIWILALTNHTNLFSNEPLFSSEIIGLDSALKTNYIYWPTAVYPMNEIVLSDQRLEKVFDQGKTIIFRVKDEQ